MKAAPTKESVARIQILNDDDVRGDEWERLDRLAAYAGTCRHMQAPASFISQAMDYDYTDNDTEGLTYLSVRSPGWSSGLRVSAQGSSLAGDLSMRFRIGTSAPLSSDWHALPLAFGWFGTQEAFELTGWSQTVPGIIGTEDTEPQSDLPITWEDTPGEYIVGFSCPLSTSVLAINLTSTIQDHADLTTAA